MTYFLITDHPLPVPLEGVDIMKTIINYSTGGLGNRLRPLSSAYAAAKETGRTLCQYWDSKTTNGTTAKFNELFENEINELSSKDLENLDSYKIYSEINMINRLSSKYDRHELRHMVGNNSESLCSRESYTPHNNEDNSIFYCNNFIPNTNKDLCYEFIKGLRPVEAIQKKIDYEIANLNEGFGFGNHIVGIHARGTDFNVDVGYYLKKIEHYIHKLGPWSAKFFLSTDDVEYEKIICNSFKGHIFTRKDRAHLTKEKKENSWDHNFVISKEKSQDAVVDMYLLSKTNIQIYHPDSTFCEIARILS